MAITTSTASNPLITTISVDTDCDTTVEAAASGNKTLYAVEIINPNATEDVYVHIVNAASGATTATQHNSQFYCPANTTIYYYAPAGYITDTGLSLYCTTSAGGGQSASAPTENVTVTLGYTAR